MAVDYIKNITLTKRDQEIPVFQLICNDENTSAIRLNISRYDSKIDLSTLGWSIKIMDADGDGDIQTFTPTVTDAWLTYDWVLPQICGAAVGTTTFQIYAVNADDEKVWQSGKRCISVIENLDVTATYDPESASLLQTAITNATVKVDALSTQIDGYEERIATAETAANTAAENANTSAGMADASAANADNAAEKANSAAATTEQLNETASKTIAEAAKAVTNANAAVDSANMAVANANSAVDSANTAVTNANNAASAANTATANTNAAITSANAATNRAANAASNAEEITADAYTATNKADSAALAANVAASKANTAASSANTAATNAQSVADTVQAKLDSGELKGEKGDKGDDGSDATVTKTSVETALGYSPAKQSELETVASNVDYATSLAQSASDKADVNATAITGKQDTISDLDTIRSGAALGASALQEVPIATDAEITARTAEKVVDAAHVDEIVKAALSDSKRLTTYTDDEKANACDTIGAVRDKKYELIEDITLTEDTTNFSRSAEPNGTAYNFESILIRTTAKVNGESISISVGVNSIKIADYVILLNGNINSKSCMHIYIDGGLLRGEYWQNTFSSNSTSVINAFEYKEEIFADSIQNIKFNNSTALPTGTNIKIYGIRA